MSPEYGATAALFPVDEQTLRYLEITGREPEHLDLVERYTKMQGIFRTDDSGDPEVHRATGTRPREHRTKPCGPQATAGPSAADQGLDQLHRCLGGARP